MSINLYLPSHAEKYISHINILYSSSYLCIKMKMLLIYFNVCLFIFLIFLLCFYVVLMKKVSVPISNT